jgi:hypothetical protein
MKIIKSPNKIPISSTDKILFLAGSIEMGKAHDWQEEIEEELKDLNIVVLNPRRDDWDSSWVQSIENDKFNEQVNWELDAQDRADYIAMYFDPLTKSPISIFELGLYAASGKLIVCCPPHFWRKGNIDIVCKRYNIPLFSNKAEFIKAIKEKIKGEAV